jgi:lysophospholipase L1-like esterase
MISRKLKFKALALLLCLAVFLLVSETLLRIINYRPAIVDPGLYVAVNNPYLPYKMVANYDGYYLGQEVKTDADGYRVVSPGPRLAQQQPGKSPDRLILVLGDSMVFGYGLSNEDTIPSQLQSFYYRRGQNYQVRNIGVSGYSSWNEYAALEEYLQRHAGVTDVVLTYNPNDVTFDNDYFGIGQGKMAGYSDSKLHRLTQFIYSHLYTSYLFSDTLKKTVAYFRGDLKPGAASGAFNERLNQPAIDYSMQALSKINQLCRERNINFAVGVYRDAEAHSKFPTESLEYEAVIKKNLEQTAIRWYPITTHAERLPVAEARVFWNDPHPSAKAVGFIVEDMNKVLEEKESRR